MHTGTHSLCWIVDRDDNGGEVEVINFDLKKSPTADRYHLSIDVSFYELNKYKNINSITSTSNIGVSESVSIILKSDAKFNDKKIEVINNFDKIKTVSWHQFDFSIGTNKQ